MNILHIMSQKEVTGTEIYTVALAHEEKKSGHTVYIISDTLRTPSDAVYIPAPVDNRKYRQRWRNIFFIRKFVKEHAIDVVNAHSRAASWVSYFAVKGMSVPLVSTIHGRQHLHASTSAFDIYGNKVIAICENLKQHLIKEVKMDPEKIAMIPNAILTNSLSKDTITNELPEKFTVSVIGRTSGPKGKNTEIIINEVLPKLLHNFPRTIIRIIGGNPENDFNSSTLSRINQLNKEFNNAIYLSGHVSDVASFIVTSSVVIGAGNVAIEALCMNIPVIGLGEGRYHGLVTLSNWQEVVDSNFGDILPTEKGGPIDFDRLSLDLKLLASDQNILVNIKKVNFREKIDRMFNVAFIAPQVEKIYREVAGSETF